MQEREDANRRQWLAWAALSHHLTGRELLGEMAALNDKIDAVECREKAAVRELGRGLHDGEKATIQLRAPHERQPGWALHLVRRGDRVHGEFLPLFLPGDLRRADGDDGDDEALAVGLQLLDAGPA